MYYRIKKEVNGKGDVSYIPQVGFPRILFIGPYIKFLIRWESIYDDRHGFSSSTVYTHQHYTSREECISVIKKYKTYMLAQELNKTKKVKYENIKL